MSLLRRATVTPLTGLALALATPALASAAPPLTGTGGGAQISVLIRYEPQYATSDVTVVGLVPMSEAEAVRLAAGSRVEIQLWERYILFHPELGPRMVFDWYTTPVMPTPQGLVFSATKADVWSHEGLGDPFLCSGHPFPSDGDHYALVRLAGPHGDTVKLGQASSVATAVPSS